MRNFLKICNVNVTPLLMTLYQNKDLWSANTIRQDFNGSPHHDSESIILRFNDVSDINNIINDKDCFDYPEYDRLPEARNLVMWLMSEVGGEQLGRVIIVRLPSGAMIDAHADQGAPATFYERFHIVLQAMPGVEFYAGDEQVEMVSGQVWWFDNTQEHRVVNNTPQDRIHLIIDIKTRGSA